MDDVIFSDTPMAIHNSKISPIKPILDDDFLDPNLAKHTSFLGHKHSRHNSREQIKRNLNDIITKEEDELEKSLLKSIKDKEDENN
jgi:hypothetical protein